jgi:recombination protein RecT
MAKNLPARAESPQEVLMNGFKSDLKDITPYLETLLGKGGVPRFQRMAQFAVLRDRNLLEANKHSLLLALIWCAQKGLEPGVEDGCWLIPFKGKVTPIPAYKGLVNKAVQLGAALSMDPVAVYAHDDFYYCFGLEPDIRHVPPKLGDDRGDLVGAYVTITLPNGEKKFRVMDRASIEKIRNSGAAWKAKPDSGPWHDWEESMFLKTVIKQGLKTVPMAADMRDLISDDGMIEAGSGVAALLEAAGAELPEGLKGADDLEEGQDAAAKAQAKIEQDKKDTAEFDGLVQTELAGLTAMEAQARLLHLEENLKLSAKNTKSCKGSVVEFKKLAAPLFHPYVNAKQEPKEGYWKTFLGWEATTYPPADQPVVESGQGHEGNPAADPGDAISPGAIITFDDRKKALTMEILKHPIPMADLEITGLSEIVPENIDDIEARVKGWVPPKKK